MRRGGGSERGARGRGAACAGVLALTLPAIAGCILDLDGLTGGPAAGADAGSGGGAGGGCAPADCGGGPCVVATGVGAAGPPAIVAAGSGVLWSSRDGDRIQRFDPAAGAVGVLVPSTPAPTWLAVGGARLVWVAADGIWTCPLSGCADAMTSLVVLGAGEADAIRGLAADGGYAFWTVDEPTGSAGEVRRCDLDGCAGGPDVLAVSQMHPHGVAAEGVEGGDVVWAQYGTGAQFGRVTRIAKGATPGGAPEDVAATIDFPDRVALEGGDVLWTRVDPGGGPGGVVRCPLDGGLCAPDEVAPQVQADFPLRDPVGLATGGASAYWVNRGAGTLMRCEASGCAGYPEVLAQELAKPAAIAVQGECVYLGDEGEGGRVLRTAR